MTQHATKWIDERYTYADYVQWAGDERWELIDGVPFCMSPAPTLVHQRIVLALGRRFSECLDGLRCEAMVAPVDVRLPEGKQSDAEIDTVVQPDVIVVCDPKKVDGAGVRGAPDLVVEVISPSTRSRDKVEKLELYRRHGVREYWIVDPATMEIAVFALASNGVWLPPAVHAPGSRIASQAVSAISVDWAGVKTD